MLFHRRPQLLAIGGHVRSGTTFLGELCDSHPEMKVLHESHIFTSLGRPRERHVHWLKQDLAGKGRRARLYRLGLTMQRARKVNVESARRALALTLPGARIVGDKTPRYVYLLDRLTTYDMFRVMIYRDCRDVAVSVLKLLAGRWKGRPGREGWDNPATIAANWVRAADEIERYRDRLHVIKYEQLVAEPEPALAALGAYLGVDPRGFDRGLFAPTSVNAWRTKLAAAQVEAIHAVAGPTLERLGYEV